VTAPAELVHRCARGPRCRAYEYDTPDSDGRRSKLGAVCDRPLCDTCERAVTQALDDAPALYVQLRTATLLPGQAEQTEQVSISRGSPMPLNAAAFHYAEQLANLLGDGEDEVRRIARWTRRRTDGMREGRQVADSARFLERNLTAWISADVAQPCELLDWRSGVRRLPGFDPYASKAVRRYTQRCPACGVRAITHRAGDDLMHCQNCGGTMPYVPTLPEEADYRQDGAA
jgi:hypothetical protein